MGARRLMGTAMLTVGLGGGSCTGKTSIARQLLDLLPRCVVLHQDSYYRKEDDPGHVLHPGTNCIDWEVLQAFHMDRMVSDARAALAALQKKSADMKPPSDASPSITSLPTSDASPSITSLPPSDASPSITSLPPSVASLPPYLVTALDRVSHLPLLLIEGICVLNEPRLTEICSLKFFLEMLVLVLITVFFHRVRLTKQRVWPGDRREENGERIQTAGRRLLSIFSKLPGPAMSQTEKSLEMCLV